MPKGTKLPQNLPSAYATDFRTRILMSLQHLPLCASLLISLPLEMRAQNELGKDQAHMELFWTAFVYFLWHLRASTFYEGRGLNALTLMPSLP